MMAYEQGYYRNPPRLDDPILAVRELTADTEQCNWKITLQGGRKVDAIDDILNGFYLAGIEEMLSQGSPTIEDNMAFNLLKATIQELSERRLENLIYGLDWITKKALIEEYAATLEEGLNLCNQFTHIDDEVLGFIGEKSAEGGQETIYNIEAAMDFARDAIPTVNWNDLATVIKTGLRNGPEGSRDYLRCLVAREFPSLLDSVEWEAINFHNATIHLSEPFQFNKTHCGDVLEQSVGTFSEFMQALNRLNQEGSHLVYKPVDDHEKEGAEL
jgi:hypothetical protein